MAMFMEGVNAEMLGYTPVCVCATYQLLYCCGYLAIRAGAQDVLALAG